MTENILEKLFEHNHWATMQILERCRALTGAELDAAPVSATKGTIRETLRHLVASQEGYVSYLSGTDYRSDWKTAPSFDQLIQAATVTGEKSIELARQYCAQPPSQEILTRSNRQVRPWVVAVQIINHATEHREQVKSMLTALGLEPPDIDSWSYGEVTGAMTPAPE